jgi:hypothetical protein
VIEETPVREIPEFRVNVKILKEMNPFIDPTVSDWLKEHFFGTRIPRQESSDWFSLRLSTPKPAAKFLRTK